MQIQNINQMHNINQAHQEPQGMGKIMQSLSPDERKEVSQMLQDMDETQRKNAVEQIKKLDTDNNLYHSIMDILNPATQSVITATSISLYA